MSEMDIPQFTNIGLTQHPPGKQLLLTYKPLQIASNKLLLSFKLLTYYCSLVQGISFAKGLSVKSIITYSVLPSSAKAPAGWLESYFQLIQISGR